ncbi:hypothetical protein EVAR_94220_1 [Eumeta japonica]|uniref:Uncharacterized protein n=1 Tax=Eumeta variegata TaxID=151549 RepID=A0A4C1UPD7_EUMVA|nr:hypothetical protein EVAR_94220_1 [Eumeta japonica]
MVFERGESTTGCYILIQGEKVEQVKKFVYLGSLFTNDSKHDRDIERKVNAENKVNGALLTIMNSKSVSRQARLAVHNGVLIPTLIHTILVDCNDTRCNCTAPHFCARSSRISTVLCSDTRKKKKQHRKRPYRADRDALKSARYLAPTDGLSDDKARQ